MKDKKQVILSTDVGFNGIKCIVGTPEEQLFNFHEHADIYDITDFPTLSQSEDIDTVFVKKLAAGVNNTYATGKTARSYLQTRDAKEVIKTDDFYKAGDTEDEDYNRFTTDSFKKLHLAVIYKAIKILSRLNGFKDILDNPEAYELIIMIELPHSISKENRYSSIISGNIKTEDKTLTYKMAGEEDYSQMPKIVHEAKVSFTSQVIAAVICEMETNDEFETPVFVLDCGGKTIGIAGIESNLTVAKGATSNRDYAIGNINKAAVSQIKKATSGELDIDINQIEEIARSVNGREYLYWSDKKDEQAFIDVTEIYNDKTKETALALAEYCLSEYKQDVAKSRTILVAGGTGVIYYDTLKEAFSKKLKKVNVVLAKGDVAGQTNGSIFAIAAGGFKLAAMKCSM